MEALGVGTGVRKLTVASLTEALISATTDHKQVERARVVGEQIRSVCYTLYPTHPIDIECRYRRAE